MKCKNIFSVDISKQTDSNLVVAPLDSAAYLIPGLPVKHASLWNQQLSATKISSWGRDLLKNTQMV